MELATIKKGLSVRQPLLSMTGMSYICGESPHGA